MAARRTITKEMEAMDLEISKYLNKAKIEALRRTFQLRNKEI